MRLLLIVACAFLINPGKCSAQSARETESEVYRLKHIHADTVTGAVKQVSPQSRVSVLDARKNMVLIVATRNEHRDIRSMILQMDVADKKSPEVGAPYGPESTRVQKLIRLGKLEEARVAAREFAQAAKGSATGASQLEKLVREDFSIRQQLQMAEIQFLKQRITSLENRVRQQEQSKEQMIQQRIQALANQPAASASRESQNPGITALNNNNQTKSQNYRIRPGDVLGIFIPNVLGDAGEAPPVHRDVTGQRPPAMGYPIAVREDGRVSLPLIPAQDVAGQSLPEIETLLRKAYTEDVDILKDRAVILVSVIRKVDDVVSGEQDLKKRARPDVDPFGGDRARLEKMRSPTEYVEKFSELGATIESRVGQFLNNLIRVEDIHRLKIQFRMLEKELDYQVHSIKLEIDSGKAELSLRIQEAGRLQKLSAKGMVSTTEMNQAQAALAISEAQIERLASLYELYASAKPAELNDVKIVDDKLAEKQLHKQELLARQAMLLAKQKKGVSGKELVKVIHPKPGDHFDISEEQAAKDVKEYLESLAGYVLVSDGEIKHLEQKKAELTAEPNSKR